MLRIVLSGGHAFQFHAVPPLVKDQEPVAWHEALNRIPLDQERTKSKESLLAFHDHSGAVDFLRRFATDSVSMATLRSLLLEGADFPTDRRILSQKVLDAVASMLVTRRLWITTPLIEPRKRAVATEQKVMRAPAPPTVPPVRVSRARSRSSETASSEAESATAVAAMPQSSFDTGDAPSAVAVETHVAATPHAMAQAAALTSAAERGVPFCEICDKAKREAAN